MTSLQLITPYKESALKFRRYMHQHPELSQQEFKTTELITKELQSAQIKILATGLKTGLIAMIGQGKTDDILVLRADIDALPVKEKTGLFFASVNEGICHSCGHDLHTTALLFAAKILKAYENSIPGRILFLFQP